jgi:hypothetical protein
MSFTLLEPFISFGGLTSWPLLTALLVRHRTSSAGILGAFQAVCLFIGQAPAESAIVRRLQLMYAAWAQAAVPCTWLGPRPVSSTKPQVLFVLPHGHFCVAGKAAFSSATSSRALPKMALFVDSTLSSLSPAMKACARLCGCDSVYPIGDRNVRKVMNGSRESIVVFPGGFVEAAESTTSGLRLYAGTYAYWIRRCAHALISWPCLAPLRPIPTATSTHKRSDPASCFGPFL